MTDYKTREDAIIRGANFVRMRARQLDVALLNYRLGTAPQSAVIDQLSRFQNENGGFGRSLEPDLATPASTAIATSVALRHFCDVDAPVDTPIIAGALNWLKSNFDWQRGAWPIINRDVDLAPHAPWWNFGDNFAQRWNEFRYNPTAELLAALYRYRESADPSIVGTVEECLLRSLQSNPPAEAYDLRCAAKLMHAPHTPQYLRSQLEATVLEAVGSHDQNHPHLPFLEIATTPQSPVARAFPERIGPALGALLKAQQPDGSWRPFWNWSDIDEAAWMKAELQWSGVLTRQAVETLIAYG
ncbi:MAG: hypothetical protein WAW96_10450 [Alphaproteobacteria bacterium]